MIIIIIKVAASILVGTFAGFGAVYIFNKMPASWLCDYRMKPPPELTDPYVQRVKGMPWRWVYAAGFSCLLVRLSFFDVQFAVAGLFACWALLIIGLADLKYMIVPDQFVIMLALAAFGFVPYHESIMQPLLGMAIGGGAILMTAFLGGAIYKKEAIGMGDVKFFAALGLILGIRGTIIALIGASLFSGIIAAITVAKGYLKKGDAVPMGPCISFWGIVYIFIIWPLLA